MSTEEEIKEHLSTYPWEKHKKFEKKAWVHRSQVLEASLMIETLLIATISHLIVGQDYARFHLLRYLVFDAEFCSFMQLRKMLSMVFTLFDVQITCLSKEEGKTLRSEINNIIKIRNMFAHGLSIIDANEERYSIRYYDSGPVLKVISDDFVNSFLEKCKETRDMLRILNEFLRENSLTIDTAMLMEREDESGN